MLKKLLTFISACTLLFAFAACEGTEPDKKEDDEKQEEQEPEQDKLSTDFLSAQETVASMGAGWNLGNTLDSNSGALDNMWIEAWTNHTPTDYENAWGQKPATRELIHMMREAGFRSIRVPVTWYPHMGKIEISIKNVDGNYIPTWDQSTWVGYDVDPVWMARVKEVVDYVIAEDMYCILNVHHDTGTSTTHWVVASEENYAQYNERFKSLWNQIATTFKDYDGRLLFEGYNEMTDDANSWCFSSYGTEQHYDANMAASAYSAVNKYAQDFVDVVRATGGNNAKRNLVVNTYAACSGEGSWNSHLQDPLKEMKLPNDSVADHLIFQVHYYPYFSTLAEGKKSVDSMLAGLKTYLVSKGAPVIIGEWGSGEGSKISYASGRTNYLAFAQYFVEQAKSYGMATFYWMGICDGEDRAVPKFTQPDLKDAIVAGAK